MNRTYNPNMPSDVRAFAQEISRLAALGPVGAEQAARMIAEAQQTESGRQLVIAARRQARIAAEMFGFNFAGVKIYSDDNPNQLQRDLQLQALSSPQLSMATLGDITPSNIARDIVTHELAHVIQQLSARGLR